MCHFMYLCNSIVNTNTVSKHCIIYSSPINHLFFCGHCILDKFVNLGVGDRSVVSKGPFESIKEVFLACVHMLYFILTVKVPKTDEDSDTCQT